MQAPTMCELNPPRRRPREEMEDSDQATYGASSFGEHRNVCPLLVLCLSQLRTVN